jgi:hypothetical protein
VNRNIKFADDAARGVIHLHQEVVGLVDQLNDGATAILVEGVDFASGANVIAHNLPGAPRAAAIVPYGNVTWYATAKPDDRFVYITTSGAVSADLMIWP